MDDSLGLFASALLAEERLYRAARIVVDTYEQREAAERKAFQARYKS